MLTVSILMSRSPLELLEQQKVLIARAMMPDPGLLVLDEPCEGLDIKHGKTCWMHCRLCAAAPTVRP
jgi:ABC-type molybdenum transport system ATPase subunit/photorepair protein PhrA